MNMNTKTKHTRAECPACGASHSVDDIGTACRDCGGRGIVEGTSESDETATRILKTRRTKQKPTHLFGLYDLHTINAVNRLLSRTGVRLRVRKNWREWGDQIFVTIDDANTEVK